MRYLLVFPNGYTVDISDRPEAGPAGSVYDASWVDDKKLASMEWLVHAKLEHEVDNIPTMTIYMEEATQSRAYEEKLKADNNEFMKWWDPGGKRE